MTPLPVARKNEEHTSHRGSMTPSWAQSRVRSAAGRLLPPNNGGSRAEAGDGWAATGRRQRRPMAAARHPGSVGVGGKMFFVNRSGFVISELSLN